MIGCRLDSTKALFFDRRAVTDATDRATRRVFSRFGAYVRRAARSSIRKRKRPAEAGKPPSSHTGLLKRLILFAYEPARCSVIIGPVRLSRKIGSAPEALEHGGRSQVTSRRRGKRRMRSVRIAARPFMGPAFQRGEDKLDEFWRDSVK